MDNTQAAGPAGSATPTSGQNQTPYDYGVLRDRYNALADAHPEIAKMGMGDFYKTLNEQSKTNLFDEGTNPNFIKNASDDVDRFFDQTGLSGVGGAVGGTIGGMVGHEQVGEDVGRNLPRSLAAGAIGTLVGPEGTIAGLSSGVLTAGGMGVNAAAQTYEHTNSPLAALASGAVGAAAPAMGHVGGELAARYIGTKVGSEALEGGIRASLPGLLNTAKEVGVERIGQELGLGVNQELQRQATNVALGQGLSLPSMDDAVGNLVGTLAPLGIDVVHGALHGMPGSDGNYRSQSEMMNVIDAAKKIGTQNLASNVADAQKGVDTTFKETNDADAQRSLAVRDPLTMTVNPATEADVRPDMTTSLAHPDETALGVPLQHRGFLPDSSDTTLSQDVLQTRLKTPQTSLPDETKTIQDRSSLIEPAIDVEFTKVGGQLGQPHYDEPVATKPIEGGTESTQPEVKPTETPAVEAPKVQLALPDAVKQITDIAPKAVTPESLTAIARTVPTKVVSLADFHDLSELHTNLMRQVTDNPNIRAQTGVEPITDTWLQEHFKDAVERGHSEASAISTVGEVARNKTVADLNKVNRALLDERDRTTAAANTSPEPEGQSDVDFVRSSSEKDSALASTIAEGLKTKRGESLPFNTPAAIANWIRRSRMSGDEKTVDILHQLDNHHKEIGRSMKQKELSSWLDEHMHGDTDRKSDIMANYNEMFTRSGSISDRGVFQKIVNGQWNSDLKGYLLRVAQREHEELTQHRSLDEEIEGDEGGTTTLGDRTFDRISEARARSFHEDEAAVETSKRVAEVRQQNVRNVSEAMKTISDVELTKLIAKAQIRMPRQLGVFKQRIQSYLEGVSMFPEARRGQGDGRGLGRDRGGLYNYLAEQQEWGNSKTNIAQDVRAVEAVLAQAGMAKSLDPTRAAEPKGHTVSPDRRDAYNKFTVNRAMEKADSMESQHTEPLDAALAHSTYGWFSKFYKNVGLPEGHPLFNRFVESATRVAHLFPQIDKARVGSLVREVNGVEGGAFAGLFHEQNVPGGGVHSFVSMLANHLEGSHIALQAFLKNVILAHEFSHALDAEDAFSKSNPELAEKYGQALDVAKQLAPEERKMLLQGMMEMVVPKQVMADKNFAAEIDHLINYGATEDDAVGNTNPDEFMATFSSLLSVGMANPAKYTNGIRDVKDFLSNIPDKIREFVQGYYTNLSEFSDGVKGYFNEQQPGLGDKYVQMAQVYKDLAQTPAAVDAAQRAFTEFQSMSPEEFLNRTTNSMAQDAFARVKGTQIQVGFLNDMKNLLGLRVDRVKAATYANMVNQTKDYFKPDVKKEGVYGKEPGFFWWATPLAQFAEKFPVLRPLADNLLSYEGMARNGIALAFSPYGMKNVGGKMVQDDKLATLKAVSNNARLREVYSNMARFQNEGERFADVKDIKLLHPSISDKDAENVHMVLQQTAAAMEQVLGRSIKSSIETAQHMVGRLAMANDNTMSAQVGKEIGKEMVGAALMTKSSDPATQQQGLVRGQALAAKYGPQAVSALYDITDKLVSRHATWASQASERGWYSPETRPGEFGLNYVQDGKPGYQAFKTAEEAVAKHDEMAANPKKYEKLELINPYSRVGTTGRVKEANVNHFIQLEQDWHNNLKEQYANKPDVLEALSQLNPGQGALRELASQGTRANMQQRTLAAGRETIDMLQNSMNYTEAMMRANAKNYARSHSMILGGDPSLRNEPRLMKIFNDHQEAVLNPPATANKLMRDMTALYYVGANPSSAMVTALQPLQATLPHLTRTGTGIMGGLKYMKDATGTIISHFALKKPLNDPMLEKALDKAVAERVVNFSIMSESHFGDDAWLTNVKNLGNNIEGVDHDAKSIARDVSYQGLRIAQSLMMGVTQHNHRIAMIAGFNAARDEGTKQGLTGDALFNHAYDQAKRTVEVSMHSGGAASRPVGFGQTGKLYGVATNLYVLNHFATSMMSIMSRLGHEALGRTGLVGGELQNARKAFATAMTTQFLLAGALGLPFASAGVAILEKMFPDLQINKNIREFLASFGGSDAKLGGAISDAALQGLGTALSPYDLSGRLGMGSVLGTSPYFGFNADDLLGATGSMLTNMVKGVQGVSTGNWKQAQQLLPEALQHAANALGDGGKVRDANGAVTYQPTDTQRVMMSLGFRPKDLSHAQEQSMIASRSQQIENRELQKFYSQQEQLLGQGKFDQVRQALFDRAQQDKTFSPLVALRRIVEGYQKSVYVADPANKGGLGASNDRAAVARAFGETPSAPPNLTDRLLQRVQLEQGVGIPGAGRITPQALSQAQTVDYLQSSYGLTEDQARVMYQQMSQQSHQSGRIGQ